VGRVKIRDDRGTVLGYGTGFLVSPCLLLTNHHVLPDVTTARSSSIEFDYQDGIDGHPLPPTSFPFDPDRFFFADRDLDFALVAVAAGPAVLAQYGYCPLTAAQGTVIIGEFVTIVQHPGGQKKQLALRENRLVDIPELVLHYAADTEPGSSGSPVFNDQWEVVALHHASVATPQHHNFNAGQTLWLGLEDYIPHNTDNHDLTVSVITGPVLHDEDPHYRGAALPRQFFKLVAMVTTNNQLTVTAYLLSQEALLDEFTTAPDEVSFGAYRSYQVPVRRIAQLTTLDLHPTSQPTTSSDSRPPHCRE
jgi:hypothetical protein